MAQPIEMAVELILSKKSCYLRKVKPESRLFTRLDFAVTPVVFYSFPAEPRTTVTIKDKKKSPSPEIILEAFVRLVVTCDYIVYLRTEDMAHTVYNRTHMQFFHIHNRPQLHPLIETFAMEPIVIEAQIEPWAALLAGRGIIELGVLGNQQRDMRINQLLRELGFPILSVP